MPGDAVVSDNAGGARAAVEHLLAAGHRADRLPRRPAGVFTAIERRAGYHEALPAAGIARDPRSSAPSSSTASSAEAAARELLLAADPPTALFTGQNLITIGAIRALRALGRQRKVALVGFDDVVLGDLVDPGITVVAQDPYALGRHAAELLLSQLGDRDGDSRRIVVPTELIARGSGEIPPFKRR